MNELQNNIAAPLQQAPIVAAPVYAPSVATPYTQIAPATTEVNLPSAKAPSTADQIGAIGKSVAMSTVAKAAASAVKGYLAANAGTAAAAGSYITGGAATFGALPSVAGGVSSAATGVAGASSLGTAGLGAGAAMSTIGGLASAGAMGYLGGGVLAKAVGGNQSGGSVGGAAGAAIGMAVGGPIGALLGGVAGSLGGSLFGNKKPSGKAAGGGFNPFTGTVAGFESKGQDNVGAWNEQKNQIISSVDRMQTILNLQDKIFEDTSYMQKTLGFDRVSFEVSGRDKTAFHLDPLHGSGGQRQTLGSYDVGDFNTLQTQTVKGLAQRLAKSGMVLDPKYVDRINNSKATDVNTFLDDLQYGLNREEMNSVPTGSVGTPGIAGDGIVNDTSFENFLMNYKRFR